jgi:hypothetical protein
MMQMMGSNRQTDNKVVEKFKGQNIEIKKHFHYGSIACDEGKYKFLIHQITWKCPN